MRLFTLKYTQSTTAKNTRYWKEAKFIDVTVYVLVEADLPGFMKLAIFLEGLILYNLLLNDAI